MTPRERIDACLAQIDAREQELHAWAHLDLGFIEAELARIEAIPASGRGPLWGMPVGAKDILDVFGYPTGCGSPVFEGECPARDAACISALRASGAVVLGKTVTTEFAYFTQGPTRNPHNPAHTPGGSSSGSAAAVADGMVPLAIGSQTAGSVIRPASFCGVVGFKPSHGAIPTAGVLTTSQTLDTIGVFARDVAGAAALSGALAARGDWQGEPMDRAPRVALWSGEEWEASTREARAAVEAALDGFDARPIRRDPPFEDLASLHLRLMTYEMRRNLDAYMRGDWDRLSPKLQQLMQDGDAISPAEYDALLARRAECLCALEALFGDAEVLALGSAPGEAPLYDEGTGDPVMNRPATLLGLPAISLPCGAGPGGLPLGLQLMARPGADALLLRAAAWLEMRLTGEENTS